MKTNGFKSTMRISIAIMKVLVLTIMANLSYGNLFAQNCDLHTIKDEYASPPSVSVVSEDVTLGGAFRVLGDALPWHLDMKFFLDDGKVSIFITHHHSRSRITSLLNSIFFVFKDGTVIRKEEPIGSNDGSAAGTLTCFILTKEELQFLASKELMKFKVEFKYFSESPIFENEIKQKSIDKIRKDASCILNELNLVSNDKSSTKKNDSKIVDFKCEYADDQIDPFTKQRTVDTKNAILADEKNDAARSVLNVIGNSTNGINGIRFVWSFWVNHQVDKSAVKDALMFDHVDLLLGNDEILSLSDKVAPNFEIRDSWYQSYKLFPIDDAIWAKLKVTSIKNIRLLQNNVVQSTFSIEQANNKSIMNVINCIDTLGIPKSK